MSDCNPPSSATVIAFAPRRKQPGVRVAVRGDFSLAAAAADPVLTPANSDAKPSAPAH